MHLSGTTMLAEMVCATGHRVKPPLMKADEQHPNGHFENTIICRTNRIILRLAGGGWSNPPSHKKIMRLKIPKFLSKGHDVVKDPRLCLTLPLWDFTGKIVVINRPDDEIAQSLKQRNGIPYSEGRALCKIYRTRLFFNIMNRTYHTVYYNDLLENKGTEIGRLADYLETTKIDEMKAVINKDLRHFRNE